MLPILNIWTDVIAAPGSRTSGTQDANLAIVGPKWQGDLPDEM
jgi:DNA sulfur modification protein DndE